MESTKYSPMNNKRITTAIHDLVGEGGAAFDINSDGEITEWRTPEGGQPSEADINTRVAEYKAIWDTREYARNRQVEYPDWATQLNKIYDDGVTKWKTEMVDPVKAKWPKDNSGPVE